MTLEDFLYEINKDVHPADRIDYVEIGEGYHFGPAFFKEFIDIDFFMISKSTFCSECPKSRLLEVLMNDLRSYCDNMVRHWVENYPDIIGTQELKDKVKKYIDEELHR